MWETCGRKLDLKVMLPYTKSVGPGDEEEKKLNQITLSCYWQEMPSWIDVKSRKISNDFDRGLCKLSTTAVWRGCMVIQQAAKRELQSRQDAYRRTNTVAVFPLILWYILQEEQNAKEETCSFCSQCYFIIHTASLGLTMQMWNGAYWRFECVLSNSCFWSLILLSVFHYMVLRDYYVSNMIEWRRPWYSY